MKKQLLTFTTTALATTLFAQQPQINNGGFETWPSNAKAPTSWSTIESAANEAGAGLLITGKTFSNKETTSGNYVEGAQAISIQNDEVNVGQTIKIPGTLMYGKILIDIATQSFRPIPTPFNGLPDAIKFSYKYTPVSNDTAAFFVALSKYVQLVDSSQTIGGVGERLYETTTWDSVTAPIDYDPMFAGQNPDSVLVGFVSGGATRNKGSKLWVDNVRFVYSTSTGMIEIPVETPTIKVFPNPVVNTLNLAIAEIQTNSVITIYGIDGKQTISKKLENNTVSVTELAAGRYLFTISNGVKIIGMGNFNIIK